MRIRCPSMTVRLMWWSVKTDEEVDNESDDEEVDDESDNEEVDDEDEEVQSVMMTLMSTFNRTV
ncbi:MAG: hypothetical protein MHM6MM_005218 [Cercozoa sp. M6MM]